MAAVILHHIGCATVLPLGRGPGMGEELGQMPAPLPGATRIYLQHFPGWVALKKTCEKGKSFFSFP